MHPIIEQHRKGLETACRQHGVRRLELFGSAARDDFDEERSDLDFLVKFDAPPDGNAFHQYFDFMYALEDIFGRKIDLVSPNRVTNPYFKKSIEESRELVYDT